MPLIDTEIPLKGRKIERLIAMPILILLFGCLAFWILPNTDRFFQYSSLSEFGFRAFLAHAILLQCIIKAVWEIVVTIRSRGSSGSWKIYLDNDVFRWESPNHRWGKEVDFELKLDEITKIERHVYSGGVDKFWIYPENGKCIRIRDHSGVSLTWVFERLQSLNIDYIEKDFSDGS